MKNFGKVISKVLEVLYIAVLVLFLVIGIWSSANWITDKTMRTHQDKIVISCDWDLGREMCLNGTMITFKRTTVGPEKQEFYTVFESNLDTEFYRIRLFWNIEDGYDYFRKEIFINDLIGEITEVLAE